jgi:DNA-binding response OmpR family regulator
LILKYNECVFGIDFLGVAGMSLTVLLIANDKTISAEYANLFSKKEFAVVVAHSGRQAIKDARACDLDAIVVDVSSTRLNCKGVCRKLKSISSAPLVLIASPNAKIDGTIQAAGIVPKPLVEKKLVQRVKSAIESKPPRLLIVGKLSLDLEKQKLARGSKTFQLTPKEFTLLKALMEHPGQLISRKTLMKDVWQTDYLGDTRTLDVHVRWLREKVEDSPSKPQRLMTVRGEGYRIEKEDS